LLASGNFLVDGNFERGVYMTKSAIDRIVDCMALSNGNSTIQKVQTEHRLKLAQFWGIKEGSRVLEIGCGQGDTTAVLAYLVGEGGFVHGIDIASPNYGSPITLGDSAKYLKKSKLGKQIKIDFEVDILSPKVDFPENTFDIIVLSHCSWYFKSFEEFTEVLTKIRKWGKQLCYAEWDARIKTIEQLPHFLAILIQAQYECFKEDSLSNVRTLFTPNDVKVIAENAGWNIVREESILSAELQDGKWEFDHTVTEYPSELEKISNIPTKLKSLINSEMNLLAESAKNNDVVPMSTYAIIAI
jgi:SAM-dependent methyltransferase